MQTKLELYQKVTPLAHLGIWERNIATGKIYWNDAMRDIYEVDEHFNPELTESTDFYADYDAILKLVEEARATGEAVIKDFEITTAKGNHRWVRLRMNAGYENGENTLLYGTAEDVTEQISLLDTLVEREKQFHHAFEYAPIGMALVSTEGKWLRVNKMLCNILGYTDEELLKLTFQDITYHEDLNIDLQHMYELLDDKISNYNMDKRYFHKNGNIIWVALSVTLVRDQQGDPIYFVSQIKDITEQKKNHEILIREQQRLDNIIKSTQVGTWEWDIVPDKIISNKKSAAILGFLPEEFTLVSMQNWQERIHPDEQEENKLRLEQCFQKITKYYACECRMLHNDGNWKWVEIRGKIVEWSDGKQPLLMLGTLADINERKSMEMERIKTLEIISAQNGRLLNFAHIVSHNLRSHSGNIQMLTDMITHETDPAEKDKLVHMLGINAANLQETLMHLNEVVDVHSNGEQTLKRLNLFDEINKTVGVLSPSVRQAGAKVSIVVDKTIEIEYDQAYLESILLNLLTNSIKYRNQQKSLQINITAKDYKDEVILEIQDNGIGIDLDLHGQKLFGMYKTFHGNGDARGIGLFLVKNQIEAMGGNITVESSPGVGTTFKIEFLRKQFSMM